MPNPLIIFENHFSVGFLQFITHHISYLKRLGYKKFLFELNKEVSSEDYKKQLRYIILNNNQPLFKNFAERWLTCFSILEKNGMLYEFIDPQNQSEALKLANSVISSSEIEYDDKKNELLRAASDRDKIMAVDIINQSKKYDGGIIFLGGYEHTTLSRLLEANQENYFQYAIFSSSLEDKALFEGDFEEKYTWPKMTDIDFRYEYYGTHVAFLDLSVVKSFDIIETECHLRSSKPCEIPMTGRYLAKITNQDFDFSIDENYVVSASALVENEETLEKIKRTLPGMHFFIEKRNQDKWITISGINLTDNGNMLKKCADPYSLV